MSTKILIITAFVLASLALSLSLPLLTYSVSLAVFGLIHVVREFFYLDHRFGAHISRPFALSLGVLLILVLVNRVAAVFALAPSSITYQIELALVFLLALSASISLRSDSPAARIATLVPALLIGFGFVASPSGTVVALAVLHNLTPVAFIVEIVKKPQKKFAIVIGILLFVALPLLIASGVLHVLFDLHGQQNNFSIFPIGPLERHLVVFLPETLRNMPWAGQAFSAVVFTQCLHYLAVIYIMPIFLRVYTPKKAIKPIFNWPRPVILWPGLGFFALLLVVVYTLDFFFARSLYGIAAALHAYIEIPLLLWAFLIMQKGSRAAALSHAYSQDISD